VPEGAGRWWGVRLSATAAQLRTLLDLLADLHDCRDEAALSQRLTDEVSRLIPCDLVSLNHIDLAGTNGGTYTSFSGGTPASREITLAFDEFVHQHPLVAEMERTGNGDPRRMSDYIDVLSLRRLELYQHVFAPLESLHQIGFSVSLRPGMVIGVGLNRRRLDFSDDQLDLVGLLHRQLQAVVSHVALRARLPQPDRFGLTEREGQLWTMLGDGLSNQAMAEHLFLSRRTVEKHLENLYSKLGVRSRWAAVALQRNAPPPHSRHT
jgi:DNA-binding CsgD family transcriptional regulator